MYIASNIENPFPYITWISEGRCVLSKNWQYVLVYNDNHHVVTIPANLYTYDGLTYKKIAAILQIEEGRSTPAWLIHDTLLKTKGKVNNNLTLSYKEIDLLFKECLIKLGYGKRRASIAYFFIRVYRLFNK